MMQRNVWIGVVVIAVLAVLVPGVLWQANQGFTAAAADDNWQELGKAVFERSCAACHGLEGQGIPGVFPPHAGNDFVTGDPVGPMRVMIYGRSGMPSFGDSMTDQELAAVLSYMRTSWGNDASVVTTEFAAAVRAEHGQDGAIEEVTN